MKRMVVLFLLMASATLAASAAYVIQLKDGKIITADAKVLVKDDMAFFMKRGVYFYLPASQVDLEASEKANAPVAIPAGMDIDTSGAVPEVVTPGGKSPVIGEEQLDLIRKRSRLANEGQFQAPSPEAQSPAGEVPATEPGTAPAAAPGTAPDAQAPSADRAQAQNRMNELLQKQSSLQQDQNNLQNQLSTLRESYNSSPQQADKERIDAQMQSVSSQLADVQNNMSSVQGEIQSTQQQLSSTPIVVDMNNK